MKKLLVPLAVLTLITSSLTAFAQTTGGDNGGGNTGGGGNLLLQLQDALEQTPESTTAEPEPEPTEPSGGGTLITPEPISAPAPTPTPTPTPTPVVAPATLPSVGIQDNQLLYAVSFAVFLISTLAILNRERFAKSYRKASNDRN